MIRKTKCKELKEAKRWRSGCKLLYLHHTKPLTRPLPTTLWCSSFRYTVRLIYRSIGLIKQETETVRGARWAIGREGFVLVMGSSLRHGRKAGCKQLQTNEHGKNDRDERWRSVPIVAAGAGLGKGRGRWSQDSPTVLFSADLKLKIFT
jgi:hypothetical protein